MMTPPEPSGVPTMTMSTRATSVPEVWALISTRTEVLDRLCWETAPWSGARYGGAGRLLAGDAADPVEAGVVELEAGGVPAVLFERASRAGGVPARNAQPDRNGPVSVQAASAMTATT